MKKRALFGGSFDPPHFGHLNLAIEMLEREGFEEVIWVPAAQSPFKGPATEAMHRLAMVRLATAPVAEFKVLDLEIRRVGKSYTVDTLEALGCTPERFVLLVADDVYATFDQWRRADRIKELVDILVVSRFGEGIMLPKMEISGTRIRERLKRGLYCGHLVPANVLDYIFLHRLYSMP